MQPMGTFHAKTSVVYGDCTTTSVGQSLSNPLRMPESVQAAQTAAALADGHNSYQVLRDTKKVQAVCTRAA